MMFSRTFTIEPRECVRIVGINEEVTSWLVEVYRFRIFGLTIWKREVIH